MKRNQRKIIIPLIWIFVIGFIVAFAFVAFNNSQQEVVENNKENLNEEVVKTNNEKVEENKVEPIDDEKLNELLNEKVEENKVKPIDDEKLNELLKLNK